MTLAASLALGALGLLVLTWVVYPVVTIVLARLAGPAPRGVLPQALPRVSCVVATRGPANAVAERVADLRAGDWPATALEVVVAVDATTPAAERAALARLATHDGAVRVVDGDAPGGKAAALNAGVRAATGAILVFTDTAQRFEPDAIRRLIEALHADARIRLVGGALQLPGDAPGARRSPVEWYWALERRLRAAEARLHSTIGVSGSIYAVRREAWEPMPEGLILDDVWLPMRRVLAGERVGYVLDARAWDVRRTSADQEKDRKVRTLTGNFQLMAWLPGLLVPVRNPVWLQFVLHKFLRLLTPWCLLLALVTGSVAVVVAYPRTTIGLSVVTILVAFVGSLMVPGFARRLLALAAWSRMANAALARASLNGIRGRWNVWN